MIGPIESRNIGPILPESAMSVRASQLLAPHPLLHTEPSSSMPKVLSSDIQRALHTAQVALRAEIAQSLPAEGHFDGHTVQL